MWLCFYGWKKINIIITVCKSLEVNFSKIAAWGIIDFPALPLHGNFCYEAVVFQSQIGVHLHLWVLLLTAGYCHYISITFNSTG